jgi:hypothetical protein
MRKRSRARASVIAELQVITYKQWLPALIGSGVLQPYRGYNPNVNPGIANEFSTAAFRLHSTINDDVEFFDNTGHPKTFDYVDDYGATTSVDGGVALAAHLLTHLGFEVFQAVNGQDGLDKAQACRIFAEERRDIHRASMDFGRSPGNVSDGGGRARLRGSGFVRVTSV